MAKTLLFKSISLLFILILVNTASSSAQFAGTYASLPKRITQGDTVNFGATIYNFGTTPRYVHSMNVTFVENLGIGTRIVPQKYNYTSYYPPSRSSLTTNSSFSDVITSKIDIKAGLYNVSIYFMCSNSSDDVYVTWDPFYALRNFTLSIIGVGQPAKILQGMLIILGSLLLVVLLILVYNKYRRKF